MEILLDFKIGNCGFRIIIYLVDYFFVNLFNDWRIYFSNNKLFGVYF